MSFFFGGGGGNVKPQYSDLQLQSSSSSVAVTLAFGKTRLGPNLIWYGDFKSHKKKQKVGKGGGSVTSYTYSASLMLALCQGEINNVFKVYRNNERFTTFSKLGFSLFKGTNPQSPWGYLTSKHPSQAYSYPGTSYLAASNYDLGQSASLPQHSFEVGAFYYDQSVTGKGDAPLHKIVDGFLTDPQWGAGVPADIINYPSLYSSPAGKIEGEGDSALETYLGALGLGYSPSITEQREAGEYVKGWMELANSQVVWTGSQLKFIPRGLDPISGNGYYYRPPGNGEILYSITDADLIAQDSDDPVELTRHDQSDAVNILKLDFLNRNNEYNEDTAEWKDQSLIDQFGEKEGSTIDGKAICESDLAALVVNLIGNRQAYLKNEYRFKLPIRYCLLEPMDLISLEIPQGTVTVQITEIEEENDGSLRIIAEEMPWGWGSKPVVSAPTHPGTDVDPNTSPGSVNAPVIFEPPASLSEGLPQVWAAISGGNNTVANEFWGGCDVYVSADGGASYSIIGTVSEAARQGVLQTALPLFSGTNPDLTSTPTLNLERSAGELLSATASEALAGGTLCYAGGEFFSYEDATLIGTNRYQLSRLYRGLFNTPSTLKPLNTPVVRVDETLFKYTLPSEYVGKSLKFKFPSFNSWGNERQELADCVEYTYSPLGTGYSTQPPGSVFVTNPPNAPTTLAGTPGSGAINLTWTAPSSGSPVDSYEVYGVNNHTGAFNTATLLATVAVPRFTHAGLSGNSQWRYWVRAKNYAGTSPTVGPLDLVSGSAGVAVQQSGSVKVASPSALNFTGSGVTVTEDPSGVAKISISGGGSGGGGGSRKTPALVQMGTLRNDGTISLPSPPTVGNMMVLVTAGFGVSLDSYAPSGFIKGTKYSSNVNNSTLAWYRTVQSGDTGSYAITASDNQAAVLYEFEDCVGLYGAMGGSPSFSGNTLTFGLSPNPFSDTSTYLIPVTHDTAPSLAFLPETGLTEDYASPYNSSLNHPAVFGRWEGASGAEIGQAVSSPGVLVQPCYGAYALIGSPAGGSGGGGLPWWFNPPRAADLIPLSFNSSLPILTDDPEVGLILNYSGASFSGNGWRMAVQDLPEGDWEVTVKIDYAHYNVPRGNNGYGMILRESSTGKFINFGTDSSTYVVDRWNSLSSYSSRPFSQAVAFELPYWKRVTRIGSLLSFYLSVDGKFWTLIRREAANSWMASTPDQVGIGVWRASTVEGAGLSCGHMMVISSPPGPPPDPDNATAWRVIYPPKLGTGSTNWGGNWVGYAEVQFKNSSDVIISTGGGAISSRQLDGNWNETEAFDGITNQPDNGWIPSTWSAMSEDWIGYIRSIPWKPHKLTLFPPYNHPTSFARQVVVQYSSDGGSTWTDYGLPIDTASPTAGVGQTFTINP